MTVTLSKPEESEVSEFQVEKMARSKVPRRPTGKNEDTGNQCGCTGVSRVREVRDRRGRGAPGGSKPQWAIFSVWTSTVKERGSQPEAWGQQ